MNYPSFGPIGRTQTDRSCQHLRDYFESRNEHVMAFRKAREIV